MQLERMRQTFTPAFLLLGAACVSTEAFACSFQIRRHTAQEVKQMAEQALASASTVVDGEVIQPMLWPYPDGTLPVATIKVSHTWKGQIEGEIIPVTYLSSCDVALTVPNQKLRILLSGTGIFTASQFNNGAQAVYEGEAFKHEIDRLLGAFRPADFIDPGAIPPEKK